MTIQKDGELIKKIFYIDLNSSSVPIKWKLETLISKQEILKITTKHKLGMSSPYNPLGKTTYTSKLIRPTS